MADKKTEAQEMQAHLDALKDHRDTEAEQTLVHAVDETRITLIDGKDDEYEYIIIDEYELNGNTYLALASCDEKDEKGEGDPGEWDDITLVRKVGDGENVVYEAITDDHELLEAAKYFEDKYAHLMDGLPEDMR